MNMEDETFEFDIGTFTGPVADNRPHGHGILVFKADDPMGREKYVGDWHEGTKTGKGKMIFASGDYYEGGFKDGAPHGEGEFHYVENGTVERATWEEGEKHGMARCATPGGTGEEIMFWEGEAKGPAKISRPDGSVEERLYDNGIKQGLATLTMANGDKVSYNYKDDQLDGSAEYTYGSGVREVCNYVAGVKEGAATECNGKGDEEERTYVNGVLKGLATLRGSQGDKMEFSYRNGKRFGAATYYWSDGSREVSCYDDNGEETGPCKLIWANGAAREGQKLNGQWDGEVFYTYGDGPRKGKKDKEEWKAGELVSSQKYFGHGEDWEVENWDDLKQMQDVTKSYMMSRQLV